MRCRVWMIGFQRPFGGFHSRGFSEEFANGHRVGGIVRTLIDHFENIVLLNNACRHLDTPCPPAISKRHLPATERDLVSGNSNCLEDDAADHTFGLFIQVGEVIAREGTLAPVPPAPSASPEPFE